MKPMPSFPVSVFPGTPEGLKGSALLRRRLRQLVVMLWAMALLGSAALVGGAWRNDAAIHSHPGRALATVTAVTKLRTTVEFQDASGTYHAPPGGVFYPSDLGEGQRVWVTYDTRNPDLVTVEGRRWTLSIIPALSMAGVSTLVAALAWWATRLVGRRKTTAQNQSRQVDPTKTNPANTTSKTNPANSSTGNKNHDE